MAKPIDSISPRKKDDAPQEDAKETKPETTETEQPAEPAAAEEKPQEEAAAEAEPTETEKPKEEEAPAKEEEKQEEGKEEPQEEEKKDAPAEEAKEETKEEKAPEGDAKPEGENEDVSFESLFPEPSVVMSGPPAWLWWLLLIVGAAGLGFLAFDLTRGRIDQWLTNPSPSAEATAEASAEASPTPEATAEATATPTPTPSEIDKSSITMRVLNGTTQSGAAATAQQTLQNAGFTVRTIGNANNQNYETTTIYYQAGRAEEAALVKEGLGNANAVLEESTLADPDMVLVVIGLQ